MEIDTRGGLLERRVPALLFAIAAMLLASVGAIDLDAYAEQEPLDDEDSYTAGDSNMVPSFKGKHYGANVVIGASVILLVVFGIACMIMGHARKVEEEMQDVEKYPFGY